MPPDWGAGARRENPGAQGVRLMPAQTPRPECGLGNGVVHRREAARPELKLAEV